jgi:hypothetical protein
MGIVFIKGANGHSTTLKTEFPIKIGITLDEDGIILDDILPQGKAE